MENVKKEKNHGGLIVIIIILLLICFCLGGFIFLNREKVFVKRDITSTKKLTNNNKGTAEEIKELSEKEARTFMGKIENFNTYLSKKYPIEDVNSLSNDEVLQFGETFLIRNIYTNGGIIGFSGARLKNEIVSYFGADYSFELKDIPCHAGDGVLYQYNASNDEYWMVGQHGHGGPGASRNKAYFQEGIYDKNADTYTIKVKVVSADDCGDICGPSSNFYDAFDLTTPIYNAQDDTEYDVVYKAVSDKLSIISYTFIGNSDGGYGLKSVKLG